MTADLPSWARRLRAMREAHGWTLTDVAQRMREHIDEPLPEIGDLCHRWKAWERGEDKPDTFFQPMVATTLGTVTAALFPPHARPSALNPTGMDDLEIVSRLQASDVNEATLEAVRITVDRLCSEYARRPPAELIPEGRRWLRLLLKLPRLTLRQQRDVHELAGWLALLVGCLEYDLGDRTSAEASRRSALSLGRESGSGGILGWAHEMRAWFSLTRGDYRDVTLAAKAGQAVAGNHSVSVQLAAQEAKAWARMGRRKEMRAALEKGRKLLDAMPYPDNIDNHFVVDPNKFDFYSMDCYRHVGENDLARELSEEVIRASTGFDRSERWPMRIAEAQITLGVVAAREGDLDEAIGLGRRALDGERKSLPSLVLVAQDLSDVLRERFGGEPEAASYLDRLRVVARRV
ncbi:XRE family transcriptional regulator [Amycolatopsis umgeniensis]|uniref:Tetratricopeptide (TPR) repeat protein n=1 Tax=Amycolatopsis umgeniensis TaxID=336628 RepID=A0A841BCY0_9PSEU|nr:tetratricopeptide repeat protein [Amycolatopsis umgeniensis]MBB5857856.1 tetratricopeptide (TPR) repeat protein [Amycolatopsis umgeniensis]